MAWADRLRAKAKGVVSKVHWRTNRTDYISHFRLLACDIAIEHRGSPNDVAAIAGCFRDSQYNIPEVAAGYADLVRTLYSKIVETGGRPLIVDCGANIGAASLWFRAIYRHAKIVAVEPAGDNFLYLTRNTANWDIECIQAGIDATDGSAALIDPGYGPDGYRIDPAGEGEKIPMISVKSILEQCSSNSVPFILKIDIEGYEQRLFECETEPLALFPVIVIEPHDWLLPGQGTALNFFKFHSSQKRDYLHGHENVFSIDYQKLVSGGSPVQLHERVV